MNPDMSFGTNMLFHSLDSDLNASLAMADELSQEFSTLLKECTPSMEPQPQACLTISEEKPQQPGSSSDRNKDSDSAQCLSYTPTSQIIEPSPHSLVSTVLDRRYGSSSSDSSQSTLSPSLSTKDKLSPSFWPSSSPNYSYGQQPPPSRSPRDLRSMSQYKGGQRDRRHSGYMERSPSPCSRPAAFDQSIYMTMHPSPDAMSPYNSGCSSPGSPQLRRSVSPRPSSQSASSTLPRSFNTAEGDRMQTATWKEFNRDSPPPVLSKSFPDSPIHQIKPSSPSLPRSTHLSLQHDSPTSPLPLSPYGALRLVTPVSAIPSASQACWHHPIPLSVIMRVQNPPGDSVSTRHPCRMDAAGEGSPYQKASPWPQRDPSPLTAPDQDQPAVCGGALNSAELDGEMESIDQMKSQLGSASERQLESEGGGCAAVPRPLSPTRLQPVVVPEVPGSEELLLLRAEIPRALKRRSSEDQSQPFCKPHLVQRNQYKQIIRRLFRRKYRRRNEEPESEYSSSSDADDSPNLPSFTATLPLAPVEVPPQPKGLRSILKRRSRDCKGSGRRARLSPLVLLLDGASVGELDTVQRAVKEISNPSQPNDEGITALHNAICWGHNAIVEFLVRVGANVSAPDSHGWTPLHCAAVNNDLATCELLVRNGAAVMAVTVGDGATAAQKCDPFAPGFKECECFLRGMEEAMGVENSRVLYALWDYSAQAPDELSFREGDTVTILMKPEGAEWWWASLCGREGFVPNNYFGLFPKVQPKPL
ncbi:relA-associated inhibitor-like [Megalops cyprinoides]|uniref:relA-associated inhibitor-like n=1 Tax=Megalops cyprinoides TaxID=118141 RepID=UPI0018654670|nr:relA-associated inhibitor-like [Megalops cyprinoides]